jgi:hypothetical protein
MTYLEFLGIEILYHEYYNKKLKELLDVSDRSNPIGSGSDHIVYTDMESPTTG